MQGTVTGSTGLGVDAGPLPGQTDPAMFAKWMMSVIADKRAREEKEKKAAEHAFRASLPQEPAYRPAPQAAAVRPAGSPLAVEPGFEKGDLYATMGGEGIQSGGSVLMPWSPGMALSAGQHPIYMGNWGNARNVMAEKSTEIPSQRDIATGKTGLTDAQRAQIEHDKWVKENEARARGEALPPPPPPNGPQPAAAQGSSEAA